MDAISGIDSYGERTTMRPVHSLCVAIVLAEAAAPALADAPFYSFSTFQVPGAGRTTPYGINDSGQIVGIAEEILIDSPATAFGFLRSGTSFEVFSAPGAGPYGTNATGLNNSGSLVGAYEDGGERLRMRGYLRAGSTFTTIDPPGSIYSAALGINNHGDIVGTAILDPFSMGRGFVRKNGVYTFFDAPEAKSYGGTVPMDINDAGLIIGHGDTPNSFVYDGTSFATVAVPGAVSTMAFGINDSNVISGTYVTRGSNAFNHGFLKIGESYYRLDVHGDESGFGTMVTGLNDRGQVVGSIVRPNEFGSPQLGFLATPCLTSGNGCFQLSVVPEPSSYAMIVAGMAGLALLRWRSTSAATSAIGSLDKTLF